MKYCGVLNIGLRPSVRVQRANILQGALQIIGDVFCFRQNQCTLDNSSIMHYMDNAVARSSEELHKYKNKVRTRTYIAAEIVVLRPYLMYRVCFLRNLRFRTINWFLFLQSGGKLENPNWGYSCLKNVEPITTFPVYKKQSLHRVQCGFELIPRLGSGEKLPPSWWMTQLSLVQGIP